MRAASEIRGFRLAHSLAAIALAAAVLAPAAGAVKYKVLYSFTGGADGGGVYGGVVLGGHGNLFGGTSGGGDYGEGVVFMLAREGGRWKETVLHSFSLHNDGESPVGTLATDTAGNLYGTTIIGGANDVGTVFELSPGADSSDGWTFQVLYDAGSDSGLILDQLGNLYGPIGPGRYGKGAVTELSPGANGWTETYLYSFCPNPFCYDGDAPYSPFTWDANGNLYGTTLSGGKARLGVVFELENTPKGRKEHVLHNFPSFPHDGNPPSPGGVVLDAKGNVYGTTDYGGKGCQGTGCGTVFELTRGGDGTWKETILYNFPDYPKHGGGPLSGVVLDQAGNLYGTTAGGGDPNCGCGVVFKLTPQGNGKWTYTILHRFIGSDGWVPQADLIFDKSYKHLYGTTTEGGEGGYGVVFEITP